MNKKLLQRLKIWRVKQAQKEGVELFRVLPNATLDEIARIVPTTPEAFFRIKGIKEGRWRKYGAMLLLMTQDAVSEEGDSDEYRLNVSSQEVSVHPVSHNETGEQSLEEDIEEVSDEHTLYTVSSFLDALNGFLEGMVVRVKGEISSVDIRDRAIYFSLKDSQDGSILSALIFRYQYDISGVKLEIGQEVIVEGSPSIWKPTGRLSLKAQSIEVSGEGALQKAYNELKKKLETEGLFDMSRKRALPEFPDRIALITSSQGAAIGDFMMNLGKHGFKVSLYNASVEGKKAVFELLKAVRYFNNHSDRYDVLVIIRGGGSLESLQAFNNEVLVREVAQSKIPTLCGIGHEKDVSLVAMAGDVMVSTPTATAKTLSVGFERAEALFVRYEHMLMRAFEIQIRAIRSQYESMSQSLLNRVYDIRERYIQIQNAFFRSFETIQFHLRNSREKIKRVGDDIRKLYTSHLEVVKNRINNISLQLEGHNPERLLRLGYSLVTHKGKLVRSVKDVSSGEILITQVGDGSIESVVRK